MYSPSSAIRAIIYKITARRSAAGPELSVEEFNNLDKALDVFDSVCNSPESAEVSLYRITIYRYIDDRTELILRQKYDYITGNDKLFLKQISGRYRDKYRLMAESGESSNRAEGSDSVDTGGFSERIVDDSESFEAEEFHEELFNTEQDTYLAESNEVVTYEQADNNRTHLMLVTGVTFALFLVEGIIHYNLGDSKGGLLKWDLPETTELLKIGGVVAGFSIISGLAISILERHIK